ncbi:MAG: low molecular weight protein-tyrosine-phosphatase [Treponema sp.]|nr:low molecular weight protein-tyrosine-phosphatase [Treponema sp.]MDY5122749.1 low molecular weight protein-tyrosine-phosphatase [Treponema sp.]
MKKILFVCHGNICRSPMAEFVMKDMVKKAGLEKDYYIESAATSTEEIGNDIHYGTRRKLTQQNIPFTKRAARQITAADYNTFDLLIGMDEENLYYMNKKWNNDPENKIRLMVDPREVADPWYTGNFDETYLDIVEGCKRLLRE